MTYARLLTLAWLGATLAAHPGAGRALLAQASPSLAPDPARQQVQQGDTLFDPQTNAALQRLLEAAVAAGLPDAPLRNRIRQGAARGVTGARVLALVRAHADSMRAAREALGGRASADELDAGAAALHAGATRATLRRLRGARADGTATTAMVVLTDLLWRGVAPGDAADAVATIAHRSPDRALLALQGAVAREGTPATARRLQALVERVAPGGSDAGGRPPPRRPPSPNDTLQHRSTQGALTLSSLAPPASGVPRAMAAEGSLTIPIGGRWEVTPWGGVRAGDATRWGTALTIARRLQPTPSLAARAWLSGELRSGVPGAPDALPASASLDDTPRARRRTPDLAAVAGGELLRPVGPWTVGASLSVGLTNFSRQETHVVPRAAEPLRDSLTPRVDTLGPHTVWVAERRWLARTGSAMHGALSLQRGDLRIEGGVSRRVGAWWGNQDSTAGRRRTLLTLGAEHRVSPWATLVGQWASHDPARVHGTLALNDARWRLGLRVSERPSPRAPLPIAPPHGDARVDAIRVDVTAASVAPASDGSVAGRATIRVQLAGPHAQARRVEVEGDCTGWRAVELRAEGRGVFVGSFPVVASLVRLRVRIDGGPWRTPPGVATQRDDFGDEVAVYVLPAGA